MRSSTTRRPRTSASSSVIPRCIPTNVRPETLEQEREWQRRAEVGELRREPFLRFTSAVRTPYPGERPGERALV